MDITLMSIKIKIQKSEWTEYVPPGGYEVKWNDYYSCFATVSGEDSSSVSTESEIAGSEVDHPKADFTVRYCEKLKDLDSQKYRVLWNDNIYDIRSIDHMNYKRKTIKLHCEKVRR